MHYTHLTLASGGTRVLLKMAELPSVSENNIEFLAPVGASSKVWDYFGFPAENGKLQFLFYSSSFTNLNFKENLWSKIKVKEKTTLQTVS